MRFLVPVVLLLAISATESRAEWGWLRIQGGYASAYQSEVYSRSSLLSDGLLSAQIAGQVSPALLVTGEFAYQPYSGVFPSSFEGPDAFLETRFYPISLGIMYEHALGPTVRLYAEEAFSLIPYNWSVEIGAAGDERNGTLLGGQFGAGLAVALWEGVTLDLGGLYQISEDVDSRSGETLLGAPYQGLRQFQGKLGFRLRI